MTFGCPETGPDIDDDGVADDCDPYDEKLWGRDADGDGSPDLNITLAACDQPEGYALGTDVWDCDDTNANVFPNAPELCDGLDNDCDEAIDEVFDVDQDGFTSCGGDCDDNNSAIHPDAAELCDHIDNNCSGTVDEIFDHDNDGYTTCEGDCDDLDNTIHPNLPEACDGLDNDCDGDLGEDEVDADGDGFMVCEGDCDDTVATTYPDAEELCNGIDDSCSGYVSNHETEDSDGDGWTFCMGDCSLGNPNRYPGAPELCDGLDNDCDGVTPNDEDDVDGDGWMVCEGDCADLLDFVNPDMVEEPCSPYDENCDGIRAEGEVDIDGDGWTECNGDCDETNADVHPNTIEVCNGIDDNCNGTLPAFESVDDDNDSTPDCMDCDPTDPGLNLADNDCDGVTSCDGDTTDWPVLEFNHQYTGYDRVTRGADSVLMFKGRMVNNYATDTNINTREFHIHGDSDGDLTIVNNNLDATDRFTQCSLHIETVPSTMTVTDPVPVTSTYEQGQLVGKAIFTDIGHMTNGSVYTYFEVFCELNNLPVIDGPEAWFMFMPADQEGITGCNGNEIPHEEMLFEGYHGFGLNSNRDWSVRVYDHGNLSFSLYDHSPEENDPLEAGEENILTIFVGHANYEEIAGETLSFLLEGAGMLSSSDLRISYYDDLDQNRQAYCPMTTIAQGQRLAECSGLDVHFTPDEDPLIWIHVEVSPYATSGSSWRTCMDSDLYTYDVYGLDSGQFLDPVIDIIEYDTCGPWRTVP